MKASKLFSMATMFAAIMETPRGSTHGPYRQPQKSPLSKRQIRNRKAAGRARKARKISRPKY
jgi:hypothetical protein